MPRKMGVPLSITHPQLAKQAKGWDPSKYSAGSHAMLEWECELGHCWEARLSSRAGKDSNGCPFCSGKSVIPGVNDLETLFPEIAKEAHGWDPSKVLSRSAKRLQWRCSNGHVWEAILSNRTGPNRTGCAVCANRKLVVSVNDLLTCHPEIASEADGWDPQTVLSGSGSRKKWICKFGHRFTATVDSRTGKRKRGCPVCSGQKLLVGFNDLATTHPAIANQAHGWNPSEFSPGSNKKMSWLCAQGHVWEAIIANRTGTGAGCHYCSNLRLLVGFNDLATTHPQLALEADGWDPQTKIAGSHQRVSWRCSEGHKWKTYLGSRTGADLTGCPACATSGFDPSSDGWLYFLSHENWGMLQVGITNFPEQRIKKHKKLDWKVIEIRGPMDGLIAREWEKSILQMLKHRGAEVGSDLVAGRFDGYTEAWSKSSFPCESLNQLMDFVREDEAN
jgi:hypothetical protein